MHYLYLPTRLYLHLCIYWSRSKVGSWSSPKTCATFPSLWLRLEALGASLTSPLSYAVSNLSASLSDFAFKFHPESNPSALLPSYNPDADTTSSCQDCCVIS